MVARGEAFKRMSRVFLLAVLTVGVLSFTSDTVFQQDVINRENGLEGVVEEIENTGSIYMWCKAFINKEFTTCDNYISPDNKEDIKVSSFYYSDQVYTSTLSSKIYELMLDKCVESIVKIEVIETEPKTKERAMKIKYKQTSINTTDTDTTSNKSVIEDIPLCDRVLRITYRPYVPIQNLHLDAKLYNELCEAYIRGRVDKQGYQQAVDKWLLSELLNNFKYTTEDQTFECTLTEVSSENGNTYVEGTFSHLIVPLIEKASISEIIKLFETDLEEQMSVLNNKYKSGS